ncbi:TPA: DUF551 domain-containing protein [Klebsiella michiganensis]
MDDGELRELFDVWFASDCSFDLSPEASEADNIAWRESYWYVWRRCRAAMIQAGTLTNEGTKRPGNSPVIPEGYVLVPKEPTKEMIDAGWLHFMGTKNPSSKGTYKAMLEAAPQPQNAPQNIPEIIPGWIPVVDRMPERGVDVLACKVSPYGGYEEVETAQWHGGMKGNQPVFITSADTIDPEFWQPLPAAPQEVKGE